MKEQNTGEVDGLSDAIARAIVYLDDECTPANVRKAREILEGVSLLTAEPEPCEDRYVRIGG